MALTKLNPFLANEFGHDYLEDVPKDIVRGTIAATDKVLNNPSRFPKADFAYLEKLQMELALIALFAAI